MLKSLHSGPKRGSGPPGPPWIRPCIYSNLADSLANENDKEGKQNDGETEEAYDDEGKKHKHCVMFFWWGGGQCWGMAGAGREGPPTARRDNSH